MQKIPGWIKENGTLFIEVFDSIFASVYAPHLNKELPWVFYCCQGYLYGDYRCYRTQEEAEDQINNLLSLNNFATLLDKESL